MNRPFFSIIIPLYNKGKTIRDTLNSIICQSFVNYEVLVINDGSTDNSCEEVLRIVDKRIILFTKENGGPSSARNYGMDKAVGEYVYFLDGDDKIIPDALWNMYKVIETVSYTHLDVYKRQVKRVGMMCSDGLRKVGLYEKRFITYAPEIEFVYPCLLYTSLCR